MSIKKRDLDIININQASRMFARNWFWFFLSISFCFFISFLVNRYSHYTFKSTAKILIQSEDKSANSISKMLYDWDQFKLETSLNDEMMILKSYPLLLNVVKDLEFDVSYYVVGDVIAAETYNYFAFVEFYSEEKPFGLEFFITPLSETKFTLKSDMIEEKTYLFGDEIVYQNSSFSIVKNHDFQFEKDITEYPPLRVKVRNSQNVAREYKSRLNVERIKKDAAIIQLSIEGESKEKTTVFLNKLIDLYLNKNLQDKNKTSDNTIDFIDQQLKEIRDSLSYIESQLQRFKTTNNITNISVEAEHFYQELHAFEKEKATIKIQNKYFDYLDDYLHKQTDFQNLVIPVSYGIEGQMLNKMTASLLELQLEKNLRNPKGDLENPALKDLDVQMSEISLGIIEVIKGKKKTNNILLSDINNRIALVQKSLSSLPQVERELININRVYDLSESIYLFLMQKRAEAGISAASNAADAKVIEPAMIETTTLTYPNIQNNYLIGLLIGFIIPLLVITIREILNDKIISKNDIEALTTIPFLGFIGKNYSGKELIVNHKPKSSVSESFRAARSNIEFFLDKDSPEGKSIVFTSSISGEGKTFCAKNLAVIYAMAGRKTILIGADLRKPKLYIDFDKENHLGLSSYLTESLVLEKIIKKSEIENLDVITSGPIPPNPSELLVKSKMKFLLEELKGIYDYIIFDTPPIGIVSDSLILMEMTDVNIYVVRQKYTKKEFLNYINEYHETKKIQNLCVLLNEAEASSIYGYSYGYGYGYGYGKYSGDGYYEEEEENKKTPSKKWYHFN